MNAEPFEVVRLARLQPTEPGPAWLVEGLWAEEACGCIGGTPKAGKTWLALELALAVASGAPCLGRFTVPRPGPVLLYAAEDSAAAVRARVQGLAQARRIDFDRLAVGLITEPALRLDRPDHQERLDATVARLRPRLVVLDPLVRLHAADENSSADVAGLLGFLRQLQRRHHAALALVHHVRKAGASLPGQALRGSGDLYAWGDSYLHLLRRRDRTTLQPEHRAHPAPDAMALRLEGDPPRLVVEAPPPAAAPPAGTDIEPRVFAALAQQPLSRAELRERLRVRNETLGVVLDRLLADGRLVRLDGLLAVPVPATSVDRPERNGSA